MKKNKSQKATDKIVAGFSELSNALKNGEKITENFACRKIVLDLRPLEYKPCAVKSTRALLRASQSIFAQFLGVKTATISSWEQGRCVPSDMACRFMDEIQRNPEYWRERLADSISVVETA